MHNLLINGNVMNIATENAGNHVPHLSGVVQRNTMQLENSLFLPLVTLSRNALTAITISILPPPFPLEATCSTDRSETQNETDGRAHAVLSTAYKDELHPPRPQR